MAEDLSTPTEFRVGKLWYWYLVASLLLVNACQATAILEVNRFAYVFLSYLLFVPVAMRTIPYALSKSYAESFGKDPLYPFRFFSEMYWPKSSAYSSYHRMLLLLLWIAWGITTIWFLVRYTVGFVFSE